MGTIKRFLYCIGRDSIVLILLLILFAIVVAIINPCDGCVICRDICISFVSGIIIFIITTTIPRYRQRKDKCVFIKSRTVSVIESGNRLFRNMYSNDDIYRNPNVINNMPSNEEIAKICKNRDFRKVPTAYAYTAGEDPSWNLLFCKILWDIERLITEMVAIAGQENLDLINVCDDIHRRIEDINIKVGVQLAAVPETVNVNADFLCEDLQELAAQFRELQNYNEWL